MARPPAAPSAPPSSGPQPLSPPATAFALLLAALWGGNAPAIKAGLQDAPPLRLAGLRFLAGGVVILAWVVSTKQPLLPTREEWRPLGWLALLFTVQIAFMNIGQDHTTASNAVVIGNTFPLWTGLFAHFFVRGDHFTAPRVAGTSIAYLGVLVVFVQSLGAGGSTWVGDVLMMGSAALLGARSVYTSLAAQRLPLPKLLLTQTVAGVTVFFLVSALIEPEPWVLTERLALSILYQGFLIAGFGFIGNMWLLKHYLPSGVDALSLTTPIWGVVLSHLVLGEPLSPTLFLGLALVILGSGVAQWAAWRSRPAALRGAR
jgi:drug/metabolite transporter (DMT)-like permease